MRVKMNRNYDDFNTAEEAVMWYLNNVKGVITTVELTYYYKKQCKKRNNFFQATLFKLYSRGILDREVIPNIQGRPYSYKLKEESK